MHTSAFTHPNAVYSSARIVGYFELTFGTATAHLLFHRTKKLGPGTPEDFHQRAASEISDWRSCVATRGEGRCLADYRPQVGWVQFFWCGCRVTSNPQSSLQSTLGADFWFCMESGYAQQTAGGLGFGWLKRAARVARLHSELSHRWGGSRRLNDWDGMESTVGSTTETECRLLLLRRVR
jgi:hypothetical protein